MNWLGDCFLQILNMSVTAGFCIAVILLIRLVFCRAPRKYLYALWLIAAFRLICPVSVESGLSLFNLSAAPAGTDFQRPGYMEYFSPDQGHAAAGAPAADGVNGAAPAGTDALELSENAGNAADPAGTVRQEGTVWETRTGRAVTVGSRIWLAGMAVFLIYFLRSCGKIYREVRMAVRTEDNVYECDGISSPFVFGILRPRIYVPCGMPRDQREMVVLHEKCHLKRKDHLVKLLSFVLLGIYWFHPLVWIGWRCMCGDMEMSCDERVLEQMGADRRTEYSRTLLALGTETGAGGSLPLAFGENDVEKRVRHVLAFRKPALWMGAGAAVLFIAALIFLGTNGTGQSTGSSEEEEPAYSAEAETLYENRNPYVGDASANGRLIGAIGEALPDSPVNSLGFHTELQTSTEPYEFHFVLDERHAAEEVSRMTDTSVLMLALTDNLGEVQWVYQTGQEASEVLAAWNIQEAGEYCGVEDIKAYGDSPEAVQELLDILARTGTGENSGGETRTSEESGVSGDPQELSSEEFLAWYSSLPLELYEEAVPYEQNPYDPERDYMVILAQTEDGAVTVYGFSGVEYGQRGITVDWKMTPDGDSNHTYYDWWWNQNYGHYDVFEADYDSDGREEIALVTMDGTGTGVYVERLNVLETWDTGHLEAFEFDPLFQQEEWQRYIDWSLDRENHLVQIIRKDSPDSVPVLSLPYGDWTEEGGEAAGFSIGDQVRFRIGEEIWVDYDVAVVMEGFVTPQYPESGNNRLSFRVLYHDPASGREKPFELTDLQAPEQ